MHVLIATDGTLDPEAAVRYAARLAGDDGRVTVLTVVEINRNLLRDLRALYGERTPPPIDRDAEYVAMDAGGSEISPSWPGDDAMIHRYLDQQGEQRTATLAAALTEAGVPVEIAVREGEDPAAEIIAAVADLQADVVCVGSHGRGLFDGLLGSTGTKLARRSPRPVLVLRGS